MSNTLELRGRTVIVTGASSGIGEATARALHAAGARPAQVSAPQRIPQWIDPTGNSRVVSYA